MKKTLMLALTLFILFSCLGLISAQDLNDTDAVNVIEGETFNDDINETPKTYTDLFNQINDTEDGSTLDLFDSYKYDSESDKSFIDGVSISKNITLIGMNNTCIDGNFIARGLNISPNCNVVLKNIMFINGYSASGGAAILAGQYSNLLLDNCTFDGNKVYNSNGGAIYGLEGSNIEIYHSQFLNNVADRVSKLAWKEFKCGMGSAICMRIGTNLKLVDTIVRDNIGYLTTILIITWDDVNTKQSTLYVDGCLFENNVARSNTVIYLDEFGIAEIKNSVFRNNKVTYSGSVLVLDTSRSAVVKNCIFEENSAISGGAILITSFDPNYKSNAVISDCKFIKNSASGYGGAIVSKYCYTEIINSEFTGNIASKNGGAIYSIIGTIIIKNSKFNGNSAQYGGALLLKADDNRVISSSFVKNTAIVSGGAIYSSVENVYSSGCTYSKNSAPKASKVYGAFYAKITKYVDGSGKVKLKIVLSSPWKMSLSQKIKVKLTGYASKWLKTDSKGKLIFTVPKNKQVTKKSLSIGIDQSVCFIKSYIYKNPGKITVPKTVKKSSNLKVTVKNSQTKKPIKKTYFTVKIYSGKKYKTFKVKSNSKGVFKISMKKFAKGSHKIHVYLSNNDYYITKKISFKIK